MTGHDLETRLSAGLHELASEPVRVAPDLFDRVAAEASRRRRYRLGTALAATLVVLGLVATGAWALPHRGAPTGATPVTAAACPPKAPESRSGPFRPAGPARPGADKRLVPGTPVVATVCRYYGLNLPEPAGTLAHSAVARDGLDALVADLNAGDPVTGIRFCAADFENLILVIVEYRSGPALRVLLDLSGCGTGSNGTLALYTSQQAITRLTALVGSDR